MDWLPVALVVLGVPVLLLALLALLVVRRRLLKRGVGTIECGLRVRTARPGRGWSLGVGRITAHDLQWFPVFSLWPRPRRRYGRRHLEVLRHRDPTPSEALVLPVGATVLVCATGRRGEAGEPDTVELGLPPDSLTALLAWMESSPPDWREPARRPRAG